MVSAVGLPNSNNKVKTVSKKTLETAQIGLGVGATIGALHGYSKNNWLSKDNEPTDTFVRTVKKGIRESFSPEETEEFHKVNNFFKSLIDPKTTMEECRQQIENCEDLKQALPKNDGENTQQALDRIFANPNKEEVKETLTGMQLRTQIDKKINGAKAKDEILKNLDKKNRKLVKSAETSNEVFDIITKAKKKIKLQSAKTNLIIGGTLGTIIGLWVGANKYNKTDKK